MKKITAILVLCLFLISLVPTMAFADEAGEVSTETTESADVDVSSETSAETDTSGEKERVKGISDFGKNAKEVTRQLKEGEGSRKELAKTVTTELRGKFKEAKERFLANKQEFKDSKNKLQECKKGSLEKRRSEECKAAKKQFKKDVKPYLTKASESMTALLEETNEKLEASELENKEELISENNEAIESLEAVQTDVNALPEESTDQEVKDAAETFKKKWNEARRAQKASTGFLLSTRVGGVLNRADKLETKMDKVLERLVKASLDTSAAQTQIDSFNEHLKLARESHAKAMEKFNDAKASEDFEDAVKEGHALLKEARQHLKDAHTALKEAVRVVKGTSQGAEELDKESEDVDAEDAAETSVSTETSTEAETTTEVTETEETTETTETTTVESDTEVNSETTVSTEVDTSVEATTGA